MCSVMADSPIKPNERLRPTGNTENVMSDNMAWNNHCHNNVSKEIMKFYLVKNNVV